MTKQRERKPVFAFYIVSRREFQELYDESCARFGIAELHCGQLIRQATVSRPFYGTSAIHAFCRATHGKNAHIHYIPALYAVIPAPDWRRLTANPGAILGEMDYFPGKVPPRASLARVPAPPVVTKTAKPHQLAFDFLGERIRQPMPKKSIFAARRPPQQMVQLSLNLNELGQ